MLTYLGAHWSRVKTMPPLDKVLDREPTVSKKTSPEQMLEKIKGLNAAFGGHVQ